MLNIYWRYLQLFAEGGDGAGDGAGEGGAETVVGSQTGDDGQQHLRELGVPEFAIQKRMARKAQRAQQPQVAPQEAEPQAQQESAPAEQQTEHPAEDQQQEAAAPTLSDIVKKYPGINDEVQQIVRSRLKGEKGSNEALKQLTPLLSNIAGRYDIELDAENPDFKALMDAFNRDPANYEDVALAKGITTQEAMDENLQALRQQQYDNHFAMLEQQAQEFQGTVPGFDLWAEMQNPAFAQATAPGGMSVEDAYHGLHWRDMEQATAQATARNTRQKISNAIQSGSIRPQESGNSSQAPSVSTFSYKNASRQQRDSFKQYLQNAWARGEKVYPGQR